MDERFADGLVSIGAAIAGALLLGAAAGRLSAPIGGATPPATAMNESTVARVTLAAVIVHRVAIHRARVVTVVPHTLLAAAPEGTRAPSQGAPPAFPRALSSAAPVAVVDMRFASVHPLAPVKVNAMPVPRARRRPAASHPLVKRAESAAPPSNFDVEPEIANATEGTDPFASNIPDAPNDPQPYVGPHRGR
jgi:hypothetical protein